MNFLENDHTRPIRLLVFSVTTAVALASSAAAEDLWRTLPSAAPPSESEVTTHVITCSNPYAHVIGIRQLGAEVIRNLGIYCDRATAPDGTWSDELESKAMFEPMPTSGPGYTESWCDADHYVISFDVALKKAREQSGVWGPVTTWEVPADLRPICWGPRYSRATVRSLSPWSAAPYPFLNDDYIGRSHFESAQANCPHNQVVRGLWTKNAGIDIKHWGFVCGPYQAFAPRIPTEPERPRPLPSEATALKCIQCNYLSNGTSGTCQVDAGLVGTDCTCRLRGLPHLPTRFVEGKRCATPGP